MRIEATHLAPLDRAVTHGRGISLLMFGGILLFSLVGCVGSAPESIDGLPTRIGEPRERDTSEMDSYEIAVNRLLDHLSDTAVVLGQVQDPETSQRAAKMVDEARPRFVDLRRDMQLAEPDKQITTPELILNYGGTYLWATVEIEQQMGRIKKAGPDTYEPIKAALLRLQGKLDEEGLPSEP
jgi:hypothetical protein